MKAAKKVITVVISVLLWAVILLAALFAFTTLATRDDTHVASVAGYTPMVVQTESMSPTFNAGDLILIRKCDPSTLQVGDIITFHTIIMNEYALNTHRIADIAVTNGLRSYTTKGDNNLISDQHIIGDGDIVGQYVGRVPKLGTVMNFLSSSIGFLLVIVLPMLIFFIYQVYHLITVSIKLKRAMALENAQIQAQAQVDAGAAQNEEAEKMKAEAEAALAEARRLKEEAEAQLAAMQNQAAAEKQDDGADQ